jgi:type IV fimbrial biogenesis protein FimT
MLRPRPARRGQRGLTLIELMVTIALLALLLGLAAPSFREWTRNAQVRTVTDALQSGTRLAQAEAVRRNRQMVFFLTDSAECGASTAPADNGAFWAIRTVPLVSGEASETVQCGQLADVAAGVGITGPTAICFNSAGRQVANASPGAGSATCTLDASGTSTYDVAAGGASRPLRVLVSLGGQVRLCDPARTLSASAPDGCPP